VIPKPFLKYAGGKKRLLPNLMEYIPKTFGRYYEPFLGGGALYFSLARNSRLNLGASLSDLNSELINTYHSLASDCDGVIKILEVFQSEHQKREKNFFLELRQQQPIELTATEAAARTIYLNKTCYNGLFRLNRSGEFNVPYGKFKNPKILDEENLRAVAKTLRKTATILRLDFETICESCLPGDFVYFDPPYIPVSKTSSFTSYTRNRFTMDDHERLAGLYKDLHDKGVHVMLSSSDAEWTRNTFEDFKIVEVDMNRSISCRSEGRKRKLKELIVVGVHS